MATLVTLSDGEDQVVFASDWPHHDFDHPSKVNQVPFADDVKRKIFGPTRSGCSVSMSTAGG